MSLAVSAWLVGKLKAATALTTALGGASSIMAPHPDMYNTIPRLVVDVGNSRDIVGSWADDTPFAEEWTYEMHLFTTGSPTTIFQALDTVMHGLIFARDSYLSLFEDEQKIYHVIVRYSRTLTAADLV